MAEGRALLDATRFQTLFYEGVRCVTAFAFTLGYDLRCVGWHNVPRQGPALLVANHQSYLDPVVVGVATQRHLSYLARKTLFRNPLFTWLIRTLQAVPIDQEGVGIEGLRTVIKLLHAGKTVLVFPEGGRSDGGLLPLQPGVHLLIKRTLAPVIPVGIAGAAKAWPRSRLYPIPAPLFIPNREKALAVVIGKPLVAQRLVSLPKPELLNLLAEEITQVMERAERLRRGGFA